MGLLRPKIKIPLWAAVAIPAAAYLIRSIGRGFDFSPDIPEDIIAAVVFVIALVIVGAFRHRAHSHQGDETASREIQQEDRHSG
ncbi:MAG: hypothetical protein KGZ89_08485 [Actinobacteria bacterium]|nr:hypothetical protein [Actinomycetota bacterium]